MRGAGDATGELDERLGEEQVARGGRAGLGGQVGEQEVRRLRVGMREGAEPVGDRAEGGGGIGIVRERFQGSAQVLCGGRRDRRDQGVTAGNALVQAGGLDAHTLRDREHRDGIGAARLEEVAPCGNDLVEAGPSSAGAHAFARPMRPRCVSWKDVGSLSP